MEISKKIKGIHIHVSHSLTAKNKIKRTYGSSFSYRELPVTLVLLYKKISFHLRSMYVTRNKFPLTAFSRNPIRPLHIFIHFRQGSVRNFDYINLTYWHTSRFLLPLRYVLYSPKYQLSFIFSHLRHGSQPSSIHIHKHLITSPSFNSHPFRHRDD